MFCLNFVVIITTTTKKVQVFACMYKSLILLSFNLFLANLKTSAETFRLLVQAVDNTHHRMD